MLIFNHLRGDLKGYGDSRMVGKRENFLAEIGRESADIARDSLRRFFAGKGTVVKNGSSDKQSNSGRGITRRSYDAPLAEILRLEKENKG